MKKTSAGQYLVALLFPLFFCVIALLTGVIHSMGWFRLIVGVCRG